MGFITTVRVTDLHGPGEQDDEYIISLAVEWERSRFHTAFIISYDKFQNFYMEEGLKK